MPVKGSQANLDAVERADAWQDWVGSVSPGVREPLNSNAHSFMRFDPEMEKEG